MIPAEIHVWHVPLETPPPRSEILSPGERDRAAGFHAERDRIRYHNAHSALRQILARYTDLEPQALEYQANTYGKPALVNAPAIEFNLSHSHSHALVAVAASPVGVDIEQVRRGLDVVSLARRYFAPAEAALVQTNPERFFEFWTRKEAFIKAIGIGVSFPLPSFDTCSDRVNVYASTAPTAWYAQTFNPIPDYIAALVTPYQNVTLKLLDWTGEF